MVFSVVSSFVFLHEPSRIYRFFFLVFVWCPENVSGLVEAWQLFVVPFNFIYPNGTPLLLFILKASPGNGFAVLIRHWKIINSVQGKTVHCQHFNTSIWGPQMWGIDDARAPCPSQPALLANSEPITQTRWLWESGDSVLTPESHVLPSTFRTVAKYSILYFGSPIDFYYYWKYINFYSWSDVHVA